MNSIYLLQSFFKQLKLRRQLHRYLQFPQRNNRFTVAEEMLALIYPISQTPEAPQDGDTPEKAIKPGGLPDT